MKIYEVTVKSGESIKKVLTDYIVDMGWDSVYVTGAIGSVCDCTFVTPVQDTLPLVTAPTPVHGAAELVSLVGEVMKRERMDPALAAVYKDKESPLFVHLHASAATAGGHMIGGGFSDGKAFRAVRIFMTPLD